MCRPWTRAAAMPCRATGRTGVGQRDGAACVPRGSPRLWARACSGRPTPTPTPTPKPRAVPQSQQLPCTRFRLVYMIAGKITHTRCRTRAVGQKPLVEQALWEPARASAHLPTRPLAASHRPRSGKPHAGPAGCLVHLALQRCPAGAHGGERRGAGGWYQHPGHHHRPLTRMRDEQLPQALGRVVGPRVRPPLPHRAAGVHQGVAVRCDGSLPRGVAPTPAQEAAAHTHTHPHTNTHTHKHTHKHTHARGEKGCVEDVRLPVSPTCTP